MMDLFLAYEATVDHILVYALLAMSQYIVMRGGTFSVGTAGFAAIGGYGTAILITRAGWPPAAAIAAGTIIAMAVSAVMALPLSRLRGVFQAVATMAFVQVLVTVILNWDSLTRGALGISGIPKVVTTGWLLLIVAVVVVFLHVLGRFSIGKAMDVIREDETVAVSLGIRVIPHQALSLVISGALGGLGGAMFACNSYAITAEDFGFGMLNNALAMTVLGGRKSVWGPLIGAVVLVILPEVFRPFAEYRYVFQGALLMLVIIYLPNGVADTLFAAIRERRVRSSTSAAAARTS